MNELNSRLDSAKETICEVEEKTQEASIPTEEINENKNNSSNTNISFPLKSHISPISQEWRCDTWKSYFFYFKGRLSNV